MAIDPHENRLVRCLAGIARREQAALSELYDATVSRLFATALRVVRNVETAEEVVADVYFQVWREPQRYSADRGRVVTWLLVICRSRALDALRRLDPAIPHPEPHLLRDEEFDPSSSVQDLCLAMQEGSRVRECLAALPPLRRQLLALAFFRGLSHSEIAAVQQLSLGTVKGHIRQALRILRNELERR